MSKDEDFYIMTNPDKWPAWPVLPVKKEGSKGFPPIGVLFQGKPTVYLVNMFDMPEDLSTVEKEHFNTFTDLLKAGWIVD